MTAQPGDTEHIDYPRPPIDIVIPVYGARADFDRCVRSVLARTNWKHRRLIIVDDCGPDFPAPGELEKLAADHGASFLLLRNPQRLGFVKSVNRAMRSSSDRDIVLLNSDTEVTSGWVDKLQRCAYSSPKIATVTPFSNNATICSLPRFLEANFIPTAYDVVSFGAMVERASLCRYPELPTGVGFCIFIKRETLTRIGMFDENTFKLGYGEEADFCMRARAAGYVHVLDDATFIFHAGQSSFGKSRASRVRRATRLMRRLHPEYERLIAEFIRQDPLRETRERVVAATCPRHPGQRETSSPRRVLHLVHGWPPFNSAGTEVYARSLAVRQAAHRDVAVYARIGDPARELGDITELQDEGVRVRLAANNFVARDPTVRNSIRNPRLERDFERLLAEFKPELLHVHHLSGHGLTLLDAAHSRGIPILYQIQDWWPACARVQLLDRNRRACDGPGLAKCSACLPLTGIQPTSLWNPVLYAYRGAMMRRALRRPAAFLAGSRFIVDSYRRLELLPDNAVVHVIPYGVSHPQPTTGQMPRGTRLPIRFGFIGSIQPHKGLHIALEALHEIDPIRATLDVWGDTSIDPAYTRQVDKLSSHAVRFHNRFDELAKDDVFRSIDVLIVPSIGLESFGLVAYEAICRQVPVIVSRLGALAEIAETGGARAFEAGNIAQLRVLIEALIAESTEIAEWKKRLPHVKSIEEHAREVEHIYASLVH